MQNHGRQSLTLFLDIDGVLNKTQDWKKGFVINSKCLVALCSLLERMSKRYNSVDVVMSSTWREGLSDIIEDTVLRAILQIPRVRIAGTTPRGGPDRQAQIEYYIRRNNVEEYMILDDDPSLFPDISRVNIFLTDCNQGLTEENVNQILKEL